MRGLWCDSLPWCGKVEVKSPTASKKGEKWGTLGSIGPAKANGAGFTFVKPGELLEFKMHFYL